MQTKIIERYFFFGLLLTTLLFTFLIFRPFWIVLVLGMSFSIVLFPVYEWFKKRKINSPLSAIITVLLFVILVCGPLLGVGAIIFNQSQNVYHVVSDAGKTKPFLDSIEASINSVLPVGIDFNIQEKVSTFISYITDNVASIFSATISALFSFLLTLLIIFYFLKDGTRWRKAIIVLSPLADKDDEKIINRLVQAVNGVVLGSLFIALVQGVLMGIGLWLFGVPNWALWGVVAAVASLLPSIGTAFVSIPAIIFLLFIGNTSGAIGLLIWSIVLVGTIDNFLSPLVIGGKIKVPALIILFSVLGGISLLGPVGILVGPLTVSLLYTLISIYRNEFRQDAQNTFV